MCTRYALDITQPELKEIIDIAKNSRLTTKFVDTHARPLITDGEVRPTDIVPVIAPNSKGEKCVFPMQWGFTARDNKRSLFNARLETASEKPTFKDAWQSHRCIIPASYYYEWEHFKSPDGKIKTGNKYAIQPTGSSTTWLCGLYRIEKGYPVFVILTKDPTEDLSKIHDRMPLMLPKDKIEDWINPYTNPNEVLPYALLDMVTEKTR
ncbi:Putative SOS response-associated peptidase YedK [Pseudobutyrivibrio sp. OR37]|uniref:SOS response-associated peptidase n=1 Tax=Pseudobutyrivibrio sp. OR37 TaxID=1798186 RepID=UPI0008DEF4EB|nr:SOS response-associated peptidase family protein [Pseudobutyrivibrio sp. OR37]SFI22008.1 Putative SOS response-associated peptidase YedK [Pseudobutyrivibrio sp. OR37]